MTKQFEEPNNQVENLELKNEIEAKELEIKKEAAEFMFSMDQVANIDPNSDEARRALDIVENNLVLREFLQRRKENRGEDDKTKFILGLAGAGFAVPYGMAKQMITGETPSMGEMYLASGIFALLTGPLIISIDRLVEWRQKVKLSGWKEKVGSSNIETN